MKRKAIVSTLFALLPLQVFGCELAELHFLAADAAVHYQFTQTKTVAALSRPLLSSGVLGLSANQDLIWQTLKPLKSTLVITSAGVKQFDRSDALVSELDLPVARALAQLFLGVLSGNLQTLETAFTPQLTCNGDAWELQLEPKAEEFAQVLDGLSVSGTATIEKLTFREVRGDYTEIVLSAAVPEPLPNAGNYLVD